MSGSAAEIQRERIGFIGLGIMGKPMVRNLIRAGYAPVVWSRTPASVDELVAEGAQGAGAPGEVASRSDIVITIVTDTPDVEAVVEGPRGIVDGAREGMLLIDMSTISPVATRALAGRLAERGIRMLDAPVSGGDKGAIGGTLSIMAGGEASDFARARPIFEVLGKTIVHCGPVGAGQTVKACNQIVVAGVIGAISEALVLGSRTGVDPDVILRVLGGGMAHTRIMELRGPSMIEHRFDPGFKARLLLKDLRIVLETAETHDVDLPLTALTGELFAELVERGSGELDNTALLTVLEARSGHSLVHRSDT